MINKNNYLCVPYCILERKDLNMAAKILLSEIISLSKQSGSCFASSLTLSKRIGITDRTITNLLRELKEKNLITVKTIGRTRLIYASFSIINCDEENFSVEEGKNFPRAGKKFPSRRENFSHNNNNYNNNYKNIYNKKTNNEFEEIYQECSYNLAELEKIE